jgi:hypothetical protein
MISDDSEDEEDGMVKNNKANLQPWEWVRFNAQKIAQSGRIETDESDDHGNGRGEGGEGRPSKRRRKDRTQADSDAFQFQDVVTLGIVTEQTARDMLKM